MQYVIIYHMPYLLILILVLLYFLNLGSFQVWSPNEAFYADSAHRMLQSGDFVNPHYNGELRLNKPPLTYWLIAFGYSLFGVNEFGLRFMHALLGLGTGLITMLMAKELTGSWKVGVFSFLVLNLSVQFFANSQYASPEVPFTFFITLSLYLWLLYYKRGYLFLLSLAFFASSLAMLVKGPAGFVLPAGTVFIYLLLTDLKELLKLRYYILSISALVLGLWWHVYQLFTKGSLFWEVFYRENLKRVYDGGEPIYFYMADLNVSFLPYSLIFFPALFWVIFKLRKEYAFPLVWFSFIYALFSLIAQKIPVYVMPAFPALAVITSGFLLSEDWKRLKKYLGLSLSLLISVLIGVAIFVFGAPKYFLLLLPLPLVLHFKDYRLSPALAGILLIAFLKLGLLPELESYRKVKELGSYIRTLDPNNSKPTYQIGHFHHNLPFYAQRKIIRDQEPQKGALIVFKAGTFEGCEPTKNFKLYIGSESRLFRFITDTKKGKRFEEFGVCLY